MLNHPPGLTPIPPRPFSQPPQAAVAEPASFDWSARLSLEAIRVHTKTDDVPGVTDDQLLLYRGAAIEAAERYTGLLLAGQKTVTEPIEGPARVRPGQEFYRVRLKYPVADGLVYLYGGWTAEDNRAFRVPPGARSIKVPIRKDVIDLSNCCNPCSTWNLNGGMMAAYKAGYPSPNEVPAGVVLGMLKMIAWTVQHPGDEFATVADKTRVSSGAMQGTNNAAVASGALEIWRTYDPEAI